MYFEEIASFECSPDETSHFNKLFSGYGFYVNIEYVLRYEIDVSSNTKQTVELNKDDVKVVCIITVMNLVKENENDQ